MTRLGQHFLADRNLLNKIVAALDPAPDDVVIEIGPGEGSLTRILAPLVQRVVAIETDRGFGGATATAVSGVGCQVSGGDG